LVVDAIVRADTATVYDNSARKGPRIVAQMSAGFIVGAHSWPIWTPEPLQSRWPWLLLSVYVAFEGCD
jgi:predicted ABC-type ATPase